MMVPSRVAVLLHCFSCILNCKVAGMHCYLGKIQKEQVVWCTSNKELNRYLKEGQLCSLYVDGQVGLPQLLLCFWPCFLVFGLSCCLIDQRAVIDGR